MKKLMVAGMHSGSGKTTVTMGLLRLLMQEGKRIQVYKTGPDYIDPVFHSAVSGRPCINLDPWFLGADGLRETFFHYAEDADFLLTEAAMGLCDGISGRGIRGSALEVAEALSMPVLLLVDAGREAEAEEYLRRLPAGRVQAILLNRGGASAEEEPPRPLRRRPHSSGGASAGEACLSPGDGGCSVPEIAGATAAKRERCAAIGGIPIIGALPALPGAALESRHLGLTVPENTEEIFCKARLAADALRQELDLDRLLRIAEGDEAFRIAIARDEAFSFFYEENLRALRECGGEAVFFSPLRDRSLPAGICGLWLPGGYPELYAEALSNNAGMRMDIRDAVRSGLPAVAEGGGFMYLMEELESAAGAYFPMCAALQGKAYRTPKLQRFGYIELKAERDTLLLKRGQMLRAHEFHYWDAEQRGAALVATKANQSRSWTCVVGSETLFAGYPHVYLAGNTEAARNFAAACRGFRDEHGRGAL
ncbi:MAG: cobyrinate/hydrogenobyrinate a,c-diamide synthase [Stomatobaculum sp.]